MMDDDEQLRKLSKRMLKALGHTVEIAIDGSNAYKLYKMSKESGNPYDLVISDLTVPGGIGGKELSKMLHGYDSKVIMIASSGYSEDPIIQDPTTYGFVSSITKPFNLETLKNMLNLLK